MSDNKKAEKPDELSIPIKQNVSILDAPTIEDVLNYDGEGYPKVKFKDGTFGDIELIMVGGAITTEDRFNHFTDSLAHLFEDGTIMRYRCKIGKFEDLIIEMPKC